MMPTPTPRRSSRRHRPGRSSSSPTVKALAIDFDMPFPPRARLRELAVNQRINLCDVPAACLVPGHEQLTRPTTNRADKVLRARSWCPGLGSFQQTPKAGPIPRESCVPDARRHRFRRPDRHLPGSHLGTCLHRRQGDDPAGDRRARSPDRPGGPHGHEPDEGRVPQPA